MSDEEFYEAFYEEALDLLKLLEAEENQTDSKR